MVLTNSHCRHLVERIERADLNITHLPRECYHYLIELVNEQTGQTDNDYVHSIPEVCATVNVRNSCLVEEMQIFVFLFPLLLLLCSYGNAMNIIVYRKQQLRSSSTIRLLEMRAFANTAFVWSMIPTMVIAFETLTESQRFSDLYWSTKPYQLTVINGFGTFATFITITVTVEHYISVAFPFQKQRWCHLSGVHCCAAVLFVFSFLLHAAYPMTLTAVKHPLNCTDVNGLMTTVTINRIESSSNNSAYQHYQKFTYWIGSLIGAASIMSLCLFSALIVRNYRRQTFVASCRQRGGEKHSRRSGSYKRCVTLLTVTTSVCHLMFETPGTTVFFLAGLLEGTDQTVKEPMCRASVAGNFFSIVNATLPFFLYLVCVETFRNVFLKHFCPRLSPTTNRVPIEESSMVSAPSNTLLQEFRTSVVHL